VVAGLPIFVSGFDPDYPEQFNDEFIHLFGWQEIRRVDSLIQIASRVLRGEAK
jgi:hypothetical protein